MKSYPVIVRIIFYKPLYSTYKKQGFYSHHQDDIIFLVRDSGTKSSFATGILGGRKILSILSIVKSFNYMIMRIQP